MHHYFETVLNGMNDMIDEHKLPFTVELSHQGVRAIVQFFDINGNIVQTFRDVIYGFVYIKGLAQGYHSSQEHKEEEE